MPFAFSLQAYYCYLLLSPRFPYYFAVSAATYCYFSYFHTRDLALHPVYENYLDITDDKPEMIINEHSKEFINSIDIELEE